MQIIFNVKSPDLRYAEVIFIDQEKAWNFLYVRLWRVEEIICGSFVV